MKVLYGELNASKFFDVRTNIIYNAISRPTNTCINFVSVFIIIQYYYYNCIDVKQINKYHYGFRFWL